MLVTQPPTRKHIVLVLDGHAPVRWRVTTDGVVRLARVVLVGAGASTVTGVPAGVPVDQRSGSGTPMALATLRTLLGATERSYQGCMAGQRFNVPLYTWADRR